jgi:predicted transcriptional regulator
MKYANYEWREDILDPLQEKKKKRLEVVMNFLEKEKEIELKEFCGLFCIKFGIHRQTLLGYLEELQDAGIILITDGKIEWIAEELEEGASP